MTNVTIDNERGLPCGGLYVLSGCAHSAPEKKEALLFLKWCGDQNWEVY